MISTTPTDYSRKLVVIGSSQLPAFDLCCLRLMFGQAMVRRFVDSCQAAVARLSIQPRTRLVMSMKGGGQLHTGPHLRVSLPRTPSYCSSNRGHRCCRVQPLSRSILADLLVTSSCAIFPMNVFHEPMLPSLEVPWSLLLMPRCDKRQDAPGLEMATGGLRSIRQHVSWLAFAQVFWARFASNCVGLRCPSNTGGYQGSFLSCWRFGHAEHW